MDKKIIIIGAGPTGLGAAYRLKELGVLDWEIYEKNSYVGGLCASFKDDKDFTWDIGGHVLFSHYKYVDNLVNKLLGDEYLLHRRNAWIWVANRWIPYPFQNNIRYLPKDKVLKCLIGLLEAKSNKESPKNFKEWCLSIFGKSIAKYFMLPHNFKVWAYPLELLSSNWIAERVSVVDIEKVLRNVIYEQDDMDWGSNSQFKFPLYGGTGGLFSRFAPYIKEHLQLNEKMVEVNVAQKTIKFSTGQEVSYDVLINTSPLDQFILQMTPRVNFLVDAVKLLKHNGIFSVGVGIKGKCPSDKTWMYFPENKYCFYRVTYFSNYSPYNVSESKKYYSLICETSYSEYTYRDKNKIMENTVESLIKARLLKNTDRDLLYTTYLIQANYAYPIPTLGRDKALQVIQPYLEQKGIYSRGRFGAWKYEVGNMDHSIMQGVEVVNRILKEG